MADLLGQMNTNMVAAYARSKQFEMPSVVAFAQAFDPVIDKARQVGETAIIAKKAGLKPEDMAKKAMGTEANELQDAQIDYYKALAEQARVGIKPPNVGLDADKDGIPDTIDIDGGTGTNKPVMEAPAGPVQESGTFYSPFRQLGTVQPEQVDYDIQLNELINRPGIDQLGINEFNAQKEPLSQAIDIVAENPKAQPQVMGLMNTFKGINEEEKEIKKLVIDSAKNISRGAKDSVTKVFANYLNPASKKIMALDPATSKYQYVTSTPVGNITQEELLKGVDKGTKNDEARALQLKYTNSIIKDEKDATTDKPKNINYFISLAQNVVEANQNKILSLIYDDIREDGNFADDLRQNPEMLGLPDELKEQTYNAIINPDNPNFNRDVTNGLLQQYFALDFKKTYDSVRKAANPQVNTQDSNTTVQQQQQQAALAIKETEDIDMMLKKHGIDPNSL